jgi:hypothetical protein
MKNENRIEKALERVLPERLLTSLKEQGKTDKEIAETCNVSPADVLLLRGWYGIKPAHIKPEKVPPDPNRKPRIKRPILALLRDLHEFDLMESAKLFRHARNEEIYKQYKLGYDIKKLAKMYFANEQYLSGFVARRDREERVKASSEYHKTKGTPLTRALLKKYKAEGKANIDIGILHGISADRVRGMQKKCRIKCGYAHRPVSITSDMRDAILEEYRQGKTIEEIGRRYGINPLRFSVLFSRYLSPHDKALRRAIVHDYDGQRAKLLRLQRIHKTDAAVGQSLGITRQRVHQLRGLLGIPPLRRRSPPSKKETM